MKVIQADSVEPFYTEEKCFIQELFNQDEHPNLSIAKAIVKPGITTKKHALSKTDEWYYILKGIGTMHIDKESLSVKTGATIYIPADAIQSISNSGDEDLEFLCICNPRFKKEVYVNKEEVKL